MVGLKIDLHNHQLLSNQIKELGITRDVARLTSLGLAHAGDWLNVVPSPSLGLSIRPTEFIMSVKYRLGCDVFPSAGKCSACRTSVMLKEIMLFPVAMKVSELPDMTTSGMHCFLPVYKLT